MSLAKADEDNAQPAESPPANIEVEQALLAAILANNAALEKVADFLRPEHFADPIHGRIYEACARLIDRGVTANAISLKNRFEQDGDLKDVGGAAYLVQLQASYVSLIEAANYGRIVKDCWVRRAAIQIGEEMIARARAFEDDGDGGQALREAEAEIFRLSDEAAGERGGPRSFADASRDYLDQAEAIYQGKHSGGTKTGLYDVDRLLGGLHRSDLIILAARPAMGKTALAVNIADYVASQRVQEGDAEHPQPVAFFSLEMSAEQLVSRVLGSDSGVSGNDVRRGKLGEQGMARLVETAGAHKDLPLFIDDTPALDVMQMRTRARRIKSRHGLSLVVVDYLQLMSPVDRRRSDGRVQEVSEFSRGLKALAKELDVPVLALSQLSRAVEQREDKRPLLSDLRESGSIEQDADVVAFLYREHYYLERAEPNPRDGEPDHKFQERLERWQTRVNETRCLAEFILAKHRHGPISTVRLHFEGERMKFGNLAHDDYGGYGG